MSIKEITGLRAVPARCLTNVVPPILNMNPTVSTTIPFLPKDVMRIILSMLSGPDAAKCSLICKEWKQVAADTSLWKLFLNRDFPQLKATIEKDLKKSYQFYHLNLTVRTQQGQYISGSRDGVIKILDPNTQDSIKIIQAHERKIISLILTEQGQLVSSSIDGMMKVWDTTWECIHTFKQGEYEGNSLYFNRGGKLISSSWNGIIKIWDKDTEACLQTFQGHDDVTAFTVTQNESFVTISSEGVLKIWNIKTGVCKAMIE